MGRNKTPKEIAELKNSTSRNAERYKNRGSSKSCVKIHAIRPEFKFTDTNNAWDSIVPALENLKILTVQDIPTLMQMFECYENYIASRDSVRSFLTVFSSEQIASDTKLITDYKKLVDTSNSLMSEWLRYSSKFGLSPVDRASLVIPEQTEEDPLSIVLGDR